MANPQTPWSGTQTPWFGPNTNQAGIQTPQVGLQIIWTVPQTGYCAEHKIFISVFWQMAYEVFRNQQFLEIPLVQRNISSVFPTSRK